MMSDLSKAFAFLRGAICFALIALVRGYQLLLRPLFGGQCRFYPSCSHYMIGAIQKYGPLRGPLKGIWRICRCHPWNEGGFDPP
jgi:putative membrane protein insertion efficiency factor